MCKISTFQWKACVAVVIFIKLATILDCVCGLSTKKLKQSGSRLGLGTRKEWFETTLTFAHVAVLGTSIRAIIGQPPLSRAIAYDGDDNRTTSTTRLSDDDLKAIVTADVVERQFLATGQITRSIYLPTATFTDEIDTYQLDQFIVGTSKLFVGDKSKVNLVGDVAVTPETAEFRFDESLMFNIPFRPVVSLTGKVVLTRDPETGYIAAYREYWDTDLWGVVKTAKF